MPFLSFLLPAVVLSVLFENAYLFYWITLVNFAMSSSDIVAFAVILRKVPSDALLFGQYYRQQ